MLVDDDTTETHEAVAPPATATLDPTIQAVVDEWWGTTCQSVGPLISTAAINALGVARDHLVTRLTAAMMTR